MNVIVIGAKIDDVNIFDYEVKYGRNIYNYS